MASTVNASGKLVHTIDLRNEAALNAGSSTFFRSALMSSSYYEQSQNKYIQLHQCLPGENGIKGIRTGRRKVLAMVLRGIDKVTTTMDDRTPKAMGSSPALITIPVSYYQVLGLPDGASKEEIMGAYTELRTSEVDEAYTVTAVLSRQELLEDVKAKLLIDRRPKRSTWNHSLHSPAFFLSVPWAWLPGALVLLQEVGEDETVLKVGHAALQETKAHPYRQDIVIAMSLSKCSMARAAFEKGTIAAGFEDLVQAHAILNMGKDSLYGSKLLANIEASLEEMAPACTLEHLSLPSTPENKDKRAGALAALVELIRQGLSADPSCSVRDWESFLCSAVGKLSAKEIVDLLPWETLFVLRKGQDTNEAKQQRAMFNVDCLYTVLIAHIARGFSTRNPELIEIARSLADALVAAEAVDLRLERAICATLLGQADMAFGWLTDAAGSLQALASRKTQQEDSCQQALQFINECTASSREHDGELPGLCAFTEKWLHNTGLKHFADTRSCLPSLVDYYNTSAVKQYLISNGCRVMIKAASVEVKTPGAAPSAPPLPAAVAQTMTTSEKIDAQPNNSLLYQPELAHISTETPTADSLRRARETTHGFNGTSAGKELKNKPFSGEMTREIDLVGQSKQLSGSKKETGTLPLFSRQPLHSKGSTVPTSLFAKKSSDALPRRPFGDPETLPGVNVGSFPKQEPFSYLPPSQSVTEQLRKQAALRNVNTGRTQKPPMSVIRVMTFALLTGSAAAALCFKRNWFDLPWQFKVSPAADILFCKICRFKTTAIPLLSKPEKHSRERLRFEGLHAADPSFQTLRQRDNLSRWRHAPSKKPNSVSPRGIKNPRPMPVKEAEALIRHWQTVKAAALGPEYAVNYLPEILADQILSRVLAGSVRRSESQLLLLAIRSLKPENCPCSHNCR
ncbi:hypothetical protein O6H91_15G021800 [Diphasiastrum complanatum]|uniref:Uncharacterized protein n=1 Tax=Diphasiastrum complanatum TaxID=34168 RepID=A0ACC2BGD8_DIPCM|nr:hypothetical protein O6H91_15G021800 [Diphasiastrum complanatum]